MSVSIKVPEASQKRDPKVLVCLRSHPLLRAARNFFHVLAMYRQDPHGKVYVSNELVRTLFFFY